LGLRLCPGRGCHGLVHHAGLVLLLAVCLAAPILAQDAGIPTYICGYPSPSVTATELARTPCSVQGHRGRHYTRCHARHCETRCVADTANGLVDRLFNIVLAPGDSAGGRSCPEVPVSFEEVAGAPATTIASRIDRILSLQDSLLGQHRSGDGRSHLDIIEFEVHNSLGHLGRVDDKVDRVLSVLSILSNGSHGLDALADLLIGHNRAVAANQRVLVDEHNETQARLATLNTTGTNNQSVPVGENNATQNTISGDDLSVLVGEHNETQATLATQNTTAAGNQRVLVGEHNETQAILETLNTTVSNNQRVPVGQNNATQTTTAPNNQRELLSEHNDTQAVLAVQNAVARTNQRTLVGEHNATQATLATQNTTAANNQRILAGEHDATQATLIDRVLPELGGILAAVLAVEGVDVAGIIAAVNRARDLLAGEHDATQATIADAVLPELAVILEAVEAEEGIDVDVITGAVNRARDVLAAEHEASQELLNTINQNQRLARIRAQSRQEELVSVVRNTNRNTRNAVVNDVLPQLTEILEAIQGDDGIDVTGIIDAVNRVRDVLNSDTSEATLLEVLAAIQVAVGHGEDSAEDLSRIETTLGAIRDILILTDTGEPIVGVIDDARDVLHDIEAVQSASDDKLGLIVDGISDGNDELGKILLALEALDGRGADCPITHQWHLGTKSCIPRCPAPLAFEANASYIDETFLTCTPLHPGDVCQNPNYHINSPFVGVTISEQPYSQGADGSELACYSIVSPGVERDAGLRVADFSDYDEDDIPDNYPDLEDTDSPIPEITRDIGLPNASTDGWLTNSLSCPNPTGAFGIYDTSPMYNFFSIFLSDYWCRYLPMMGDILFALSLIWSTVYFFRSA